MDDCSRVGLPADVAKVSFSPPPLPPSRARLVKLVGVDAQRRSPRVQLGPLLPLQQPVEEVVVSDVCISVAWHELKLYAPVRSLQVFLPLTTPSLA